MSLSTAEDLSGPISPVSLDPQVAHASDNIHRINEALTGEITRNFHDLVCIAGMSAAYLGRRTQDPIIIKHAKGLAALNKEISVPPKALEDITTDVPDLVREHLAGLQTALKDTLMLD